MRAAASLGVPVADEPRRMDSLALSERRTGSGSLKHVSWALALLLTLLITPKWGSAQGETPKLEISKAVVGSTSVPSGQMFSYRLLYRCASITEDCRDVTVTDVLPPELSNLLDDVVLTGTTHIFSMAYDQVSRTATWTFVDPLPAGSTGELRLKARFPAGVCVDGTTATNTAKMQASNAPAATSNQATVTATAQNNFTVDKQLASYGGIDGETTYRLRLCNPANGDIGGLNLTEITMVDPLPEGALFVRASDGGEYHSDTHSVSWSLPDMKVSGSRTCVSRTVTVRFPSPPFQVGDKVNNELIVRGVPVGKPRIELKDVLSHTLEAPSPEAGFVKGEADDQSRAVLEDTLLRYRFGVENRGLVPLAQFVVTDPVPPALHVVAVQAGSNNQGSGSFLVNVQYRTNLNSSWVDLPGSPFDTPPAHRVEVSSLGLAEGELITALRWDFGTLPLGFRSRMDAEGNGFDATVMATDRDGSPVEVGQVITNTAEASYEYEGDIQRLSDSHDVTVIGDDPVPVVRKRVLSGDPAGPGDVVEYELSLENHRSARGDLDSPVLADLLDENLEYVSGSWRSTAGIQPVKFNVLKNYRGSGRTLLQWQYNRVRFAPEAVSRVAFRVRVKPGATPGGLDNIGALSEWRNSSVDDSQCLERIADVNDLDGDGDVDEPLCSAIAGIAITPTASLESVKWIKGQLDSGWNRFPKVARTAPGGKINYRIIVTNTGNVPMTDILVIDILPHIGDTGVIDLTDRRSEWRPYLTGPVDAPANVMVYYSTQPNPCRPELVPGGPKGCSPAGWSTAPPSDIQSVASLRFDFGDMVLNPTEQIELKWPMRAPHGAPKGGHFAWNSFGYVASGTDGSGSILASEPIKVGVQVRVPSPTSTPTPTPTSGVLPYTGPVPSEVSGSPLDQVLRIGALLLGLIGTLVVGISLKGTVDRRPNMLTRFLLGLSMLMAALALVVLGPSSPPAAVTESIDRSSIKLAYASEAQPEATLPAYPTPIPPPAIGPVRPGAPLDTSSVTRLVIPSLGVDSEVKYVPFDGTTWNVNGLKQEIAWLGDTSWPGLGSNTVLAGHLILSGGVSGPFERLDDLRPGDQVLVYTEKGLYVYVTDGQRVVDERDFSVVEASIEPQLTLLTCTGWDPLLKRYLKRRVVVANLSDVSPLGDT